MKRWLVWVLLGMIQPSLFSQAPPFTIQCPSVVSIYNGTATDTVTAVVPSQPTQTGATYRWSVLSPTNGPTSLATLTGVQGKESMTFRGTAPGQFQLICAYGTTPQVSKLIEVLPNPNLQIIVPTILTKGAKGITARIVEPSSGCRDLRYEWLPTPGVEILSGLNTNTVTFNLTPFYNGGTLNTAIKLFAKVTTPAGKVFQATSPQISLVNPPDARITTNLRTAATASVGDSVFAYVPYAAGNQYAWTVDGVVRSNQPTISFSVQQEGVLTVACNVTNSAGVSSSLPITINCSVPQVVGQV